LFLQSAVPPYLYQHVTTRIVQSASLSDLKHILTDSGEKLEGAAHLALLDAIGETDNPIFLPLLLDIMENEKMNNEICANMAKIVNKFSLGREVVEKLAQILQRSALLDVLHESPFPNSIFQTLWIASHKVNVLVMQEGTKYQIIEREKLILKRTTDTY
jgi:hypothetical protein